VLHKKAVSMNVVELIVIVLVLSLVLFFVVYIFKPGIESASSKSSCEESVLLKAKAKNLKLESKVDLQCETTKLKIDEINKKNTRKIADAMYDCWDQFGGGKVDFLSDWDFGGTDTFCFICSKVEFDSSIKGNKLDLGAYLNENNPQLHNLTYNGYFTGTKEAKLNLDFLNNLNTDKPFYILFFAKKDFDISTLYNWKSGGAAAVGCAAGAKIGGAVGSLLFGAAAIPSAGIGCAGGAIVSYSFYALTEKNKYTPGMYIIDSQEVVKICG